MNPNGILYVCCGPPGCGKSTFLNEMKSDDEIIISRDAIRYALLKPGEDYHAHEHEAYVKFLTEITKNIRNGVNVYADATHLNQKSRYALLHSLHNYGCRPSEINAIYFNVPLETCKERNEFRKGTKAYCPVKDLEDMYCAYDFPRSYEGFANIWEVNMDGEVEITYEEG